MLALLFFALGVAGGVLHWRYERPSFWFLGPLVLTVTVALVYYMNFKYGASQAPELAGVPREVRDRDYFYLWSFATWSVWAALGLASAWRGVAERLHGTESRRWLLASPVLFVGLVPLVGNWSQASRAGESATREWAHDLLNSVEPYGVLITLGDNDTFPLWYAQEVEGVRRDVTVAVTSLLNTDWYPRGLKRRVQVAYDAEHGPAAYRGMQLAKPSSPVFSLTPGELDAVPEMLNVTTPQLFQHGAIRAVVDPRKLEYGVPTRGDLMVLQLIKDNIGVRPVYVARTSGNYVSALGLEPYALMQGLAVKIMPNPVVASPDTVAIEGNGHFDVRRTKALWQAYGAPAAIVRRGDWVDKPSIGIPYVYIATASVLAEVLARRGEQADSDRAKRQAMDVAAAARLLDLFAPPDGAGRQRGGGDARMGVPVPP